MTKQAPCSEMILNQQLLYLGKLARLPDYHLLRMVTFCPGSLRVATDQYIRKVGGPKLEWAAELLKVARRSTGGNTDVINDASAWVRLVRNSQH